jgi:YVTN family beta-propeller protein
VALAACSSKGSPATTSSSPSAASSPVVQQITPEATIAVAMPAGLAYDGTRLWVFTGSGQGARLDPATNTLGSLVTLDPKHEDGGFTANKQGLWLNDFNTSVLYRVDPVSLKIVTRIAVGPNPNGIAVDPENHAVWVANHRGGTVARIDPATNRVVAKVAVGNPGRSGPQQVGLGLGSVWVGVPNSASVYRIDPLTNKVTATIAFPPNASPCGGFAFSEQAVWTPGCHDATSMVRIDPVTNTVVATIQLGGYGSDAVLVDGAPWLVVESLIDGPATNKVDGVLSLGDDFKGGGLLIAAGSVWSTDWPGNQVLRLPLSALHG